MLNQDGQIPWDTLLFVIGHINYGGRVTDDNDRRCLLAILEKFVTPEILKPDYCFSESGTYRCPPTSDTGSLEDFREFVQTFPLSEHPEVFGMHENANITFMKQESEKVLNVVLSIQPREAGGGSGKSPEEIVGELAATQATRVPSLLSQETAHPSSFAIVPETGLMISMGTCLSQEMARFNDLLAQLSKTLHEQQRAVKGITVMTSELDAMFNSMLNNQVPTIWTKDGIGYPSLKPLFSWFEDMILRVAFIRSWIEQGAPNTFWISAMYFPQGFLTSVLQGYSRAEMIPVDQLSFEFDVEATDNSEEIVNAPEQGIFIHGLFIDGAAWDYDEMVICDQQFGVMYEKCPVINFFPVQLRKKDFSKYHIPLYKTSVRAGTLSTTGHSTNYVLSIEVSTSEPPSYWILKGAALLTMLND